MKRRDHLHDMIDSRKITLETCNGNYKTNLLFILWHCRTVLYERITQHGEKESISIEFAGMRSGDSSLDRGNNQVLLFRGRKNMVPEEIEGKSTRNQRQF